MSEAASGDESGRPSTADTGAPSEADPSPSDTFPGDREDKSPPSDTQQLVRISAAFVLLLAVGVILWLGRGFLIPFTIALLLAAAVAPPAKWLERRVGVPHWATTTLALLLTCGMTALVLALGYLGMADIVEQAPKYRQDAVSAYTSLRGKIEDNFGKAAADQMPSAESILPSQGAGQQERSGKSNGAPSGERSSDDDANKAARQRDRDRGSDAQAEGNEPEDGSQEKGNGNGKPKSLKDSPGGKGQGVFGSSGPALSGGSTGRREQDDSGLRGGRSSGALARNFFGLLSKTANSSLNIISGFFISLLFFAFFLIQRDALARKLRHYVHDRGHGKRETKDMFGDMSSRVVRYLWLKAAISVVTGIVFGLVAWIGGLPFALFWGFVGFALNFIPAIGPVLASVPPVLLCYAQFSPGYATVLSIALVGVQTLSGNVVEPKLLGDHLDMNIITVLLCLFFWGIVWGPMGMLLAVPLTAIIQIALEQQASTRPFAKLMGSTSES